MKNNKTTEQVAEGNGAQFAHTPAPWRIGNSFTVISDSEEGITVIGATGPEAVECYGGNLIGESVSPANAERIVACVNAMEGVENPAAYIQSARDAVTEGLRLEKQRDQLLHMLEQIVLANIKDKQPLHNTLAFEDAAELVARIKKGDES